MSLDKIRESVAKLRQFARREKEAFIGDSMATDSAERNLQTAIQAVIDIGNHIVADMDLGTPKDYKDVFRLLAQKDIVAEPLSQKLISRQGSGMCWFMTTWKSICTSFMKSSETISTTSINSFLTYSN